MTRLLPLLALLLAAVPSVAHAQDSLALGSPVPLADQPFATPDGGTLTLAAASGDGGLVLVMWSAACPWTERYTARLAEINASTVANGIGLVLVSSNDPGRSPGDTPEALTASAAAVGAPVVLDPGAVLADALGAQQTPEAFFFGAGGLLYSGAVDDSPAEAARVTIAYLQQAVDQSLAEQPVEIERTTPFGCTIKRPR